MCLHQPAAHRQKCKYHLPPLLNAIPVPATFFPPQAIQYVQSHPDEVCPAGWKPGDKTMNPSPKKSKDYFKAI